MRDDQADWKTLFRPTVSQWVLGDLPPGEVPAQVLLSCENPEYYDDGEVSTRLEHVQRRGRFILGTFNGQPMAVAASSKFGSPSVAMAADILATAGAVLVTSDNPLLKRQTDPSRVQVGYRRALDVTLEALSALPGRVEG